MNILVTGATGTVGEPLVRFLQRASSEHRFFFTARRPAIIRHKIDAKTWQIRQFDFEDIYSFKSALKEIDRLFLLRPPNLTDVKGYILPLLKAAKEAEVKLIVFLSIQSADKNKWTPHYKIEKALKESGINYIFLRSGFFMQNFLQEIREDITKRDEVFVPAGSNRFSFIDAEELAEVTADLLLNAPEASQIYTLTGTSPMDYYRVATVASEALGRPIRYTNPNPFWFIFRKMMRGRSLMFAFIQVVLYRFNRVPPADQYRHTLQRLLNRPPKSLSAFFIEHQEELSAQKTIAPTTDKTRD
ncbi:MAG: NmrA family NAD(P)-binding protein [Phaeodactylibacter sp.]|uniref:NmrA family NAD(P)-binding protein n=1 Tax=Phaeodactylibacter sp. TaxID=1940289 RepID=UPI0032EBDECB